MPRPVKFRRVCCLPVNNEFIPVIRGADEPVILAVDEYEAIRLIDNEGLSQEQCSEYMRVARTTVQQIYDTARKKVADALVNGRGIKIEGGSYTLCDGTGKLRGCGHCRRFGNGWNTKEQTAVMPDNQTQYNE